MEFRVLGPITATHDGQPVALGRRRERLMLGVLLLEDGRSVPADRLFELLWGDGAEPADRARLHTAVARLRGLLAPYGVRLVSGPGGYAVEAGDAEVDAHRFVAEVAAARAEPHPGRRADGLAAALAEWQGPLLADIADMAGGRLADRIGAPLRELRLVALEERAEADLAAGRAATVATYLADVAHDHPTRERLVGGLMTALARTGRSQDALAIYRSVYQHLGDELGTEPGPELQDLHTRILRHDAAVLDEPPAGDAVTGKTAPGEATPIRMLPRDLPGFVGREGDLKALDAVFATDGPPPIAVVSGAGGIGKTALAVRWAHLAADRYPDGQLHIDLRGFSGTAPVSAHDALTQLIVATGLTVDVVPGGLDAAAALYRSRMDGRRVLVLLDNAATADQVRPLIPAGKGAGVLVTSRNRLDGLIAREGAQQLVLGPLPRAQSLAVLRTVVGADRVDAEVEAASDLAGLCGDLPLALRVAAASLAARGLGSIADYCARIRAGNPLDALTIPGDEGFAVRTVLRQSYEALDAPTRRLLRLLAVPSGDQIGLDAVAALLGREPPTALALLGMLINAHLVDEPVAGRFAMHDLVRAFAIERLATDAVPGERDDGRRRLLGYYIHMADAARGLTTPAVGALLRRGPVRDGVMLTELNDAAAAWAWLDLEIVNLTAETVTAADHGPRPAAYLIAEALYGYFWTRRDHARWLTVMSAGDRAARAEGDLLAQACLALLLGNVHWALTDHDLAAQSFERSLDAARAVGDPSGQAAALTDLAGLSRACGRLADARRLAEMAREQHLAGPSREQGINALITAWIDMDLGDYASAVDHAGRALEILRATGSQGGAMQALNLRGEALVELGDLTGAKACAEEVLAHAVDWGVRLNELSATCLLANVARHENRIADGLRLAERAIELAHFIDSPAITGHIYVYRADLHLAAADLDAAEADYAWAVAITESVSQPHARILARLGRARVAARRGEVDAARDLARAAAEVAAATELRELQRRIAALQADLDAGGMPSAGDPVRAGGGAATDPGR